jgi:hypothetical protein
MSRRGLLAAVLLALVGLTACDRTDTDFGDGGVVRIGLAVDDVVPIPLGEQVGLLFAMGHVPGSARVAVSAITSDGATQSTEQLPRTFTSP